MTGHISLKDLPNLKVSYKNAIDNNLSEFTFNNHPLLVAYAKYLIEYLESINK